MKKKKRKSTGPSCVRFSLSRRRCRDGRRGFCREGDGLLIMKMRRISAGLSLCEEVRVFVLVDRVGDSKVQRGLSAAMVEWRHDLKFGGVPVLAMLFDCLGTVGPW